MPITSPAQVEQRAARVAGIDRGVGLDERHDAVAGQRARLGADDARRSPCCSSPYGAPMATTHSPTRVAAGLPVFTVGRSLASILSTATSVTLSLPSTLALNSRWSVSFTVTSSASATTWALVRIMPSAPTMKPDPMPRDRLSGLGPVGASESRHAAEERAPARAAGRAAHARGERSERALSCRPTCSSRPRPAPCFATRSAKSGSAARRQASRRRRR